MQKIGITNYSAYGIYIYDIGNLMLDCDEHLLGFGCFRDRACKYANEFTSNLRDITDPDLIVAITLAACTIYEQWSNNRSAEVIADITILDIEEVKERNLTFKDVIDCWIYENSLRFRII